MHFCMLTFERQYDGKMALRLLDTVVASSLSGNWKKKYAAESVYQTCNLSANFSRHMAYIATHNRTVNISGKSGEGKPVDQLIEHYNL